MTTIPSAPAIITAAAAASPDFLGAGILRSVVSVASKATKDTVLVSGRYPKAADGDNSGQATIIMQSRALAEALCSAKANPHKVELSRARAIMACAIYAPTIYGGLVVAATGQASGDLDVDRAIRLEDNASNDARGAAAKVGGVLLKAIDEVLLKHVADHGSTSGFNVHAALNCEKMGREALGEMREALQDKLAADARKEASASVGGEETDPDALHARNDERLRAAIARWVKAEGHSDDLVAAACDTLIRIGVGAPSWQLSGRDKRKANKTIGEALARLAGSEPVEEEKGEEPEAPTQEPVTSEVTEAPAPKEEKRKRGARAKASETPAPDMPSAPDAPTLS